MEDEFEREFADELSMVQEEGLALASETTCEVSRKRCAKDCLLEDQRLKVPRLNGEAGSLPSLPEDDFEGEEETASNTRAESPEVDGGIGDSSNINPRHLISESVSPSYHVLKRAPLGNYITVTSGVGDRVYLRMKSQKTKLNQSRSLHAQSGLQLLKLPFTELLTSVEEEKRRKLVERSNDVLLSLKSCHSDELEEGSQLLFSDPESSHKDTEEHRHLLWVEKYSPKHYTELLSDDGINRTLLAWLKLWDEVVFGRPIALKGKPGGGGTSTKNSHIKEENTNVKRLPGKKFEKRTEYQDPATFSGAEALDETGRPKIKLALLCGAPGLGKTTLAHIIAKHAGYNVVEMNASDDRSPEIFAHMIESSTQMQAVLTPASKPNCLVIDEIDGAPTAAINILIDLVKKKDTTAATKKKTGTGLLSRPIICICNDQYAPSLRQLRQYSLLLNFPPTVTARLASRLKQVVKQEKMTAAVSTLIALCEKTDNDIRSCLNTLQFLSQKQSNISLALIQGTNVGQKDAQRSLFSLWKEIFQLPAAKKHTLNQGPLKLAAAESGVAQNRGMSGHSSRFYNILSACIANGEHEKVANGLFENYLSVKFKDPNMEAISVGQDWMVFSDELQQQIAHSQNYILMGYLPFLSVAFHFLYAAPSRPPIRYPNTSYEVFLQKQKSKHLLTSLLTEVPPQIKRTITPALLVIEILPPLSEILAPTFRPVSTQLYSSRERQQFVDLVGTMISYGLTFRQERGQDGQYSYILEPHIEELTRFSGLVQKRQLSYSTKQLIAREIEVEKLRRAEAFLTNRNESTNECHKSYTKEKVECRKEARPKPLVAQLKKEGKEQGPVDFFGRRISQNSSQKSGSASHSSALHSLWFRFNEGFSNAVRRPVRMKDLM